MTDMNTVSSNTGIGRVNVYTNNMHSCIPFTSKKCSGYLGACKRVKYNSQ